MSYNDFVSGGSTLVSPTVCQAFIEAILRQAKIEEQYNRDNNTRKVNYIKASVDLISGVFTGSVLIPLKPLVTVGTFSVKHDRVDYTPGYVTFEAGTGQLIEAINLPDAIGLLADRIDSTERYIVADVVTVTPNTIKILEDTDVNLTTIAFNLPCSVLIDPVTGDINIRARGFLQRLDDQIAAGEMVGLPG